jgi:hypothetical protein
MQDLTLVGVHDDGEHLVVRAKDGTTFKLRVDEPLRVAVRLDRARLGQAQLQAEGGLRPREIQARIRAGQSAEQVAQNAGVPLEYVRRYEGPVLAEREFVAGQARAVRLRRPGQGGGPAPALEDVVHQRLSAREVDESAATWDAWRSENGTWVVVLDFVAGGRERRARWSYDPQLRHVTPTDDEARWLTDEEPPEPGPLAQRRLVPVRAGRGPAGAAEAGEGPAARDRVYDVEADGGVRPADGHRDDRRDERRESPAAPAPAAAATVDLLDTLRERRGRRPRVVVPAGDGTHSETDALDLALDGLRARAEQLGEPPAPIHRAPGPTSRTTRRCSCCPRTCLRRHRGRAPQPWAQVPAQAPVPAPGDVSGAVHRTAGCGPGRATARRRAGATRSGCRSGAGRPGRR